jgi:hypothetical protein
VLCVELQPGAADTPALRERLRHEADAHAHTTRIEQFLMHPGFPVDIRHNAKIGREKLAIWAATQVETHA